MAKIDEILIISNENIFFIRLCIIEKYYEDLCVK